MGFNYKLYKRRTSDRGMNFSFVKGFNDENDAIKFIKESGTIFESINQYNIHIHTNTICWILSEVMGCSEKIIMMTNDVRYLDVRK